MTASRLASWATPVAFVFLVTGLALIGAISRVEAVGSAVSVMLAFGPSGWFVPAGWKRRASEALLLPPAIVLVMIGSPAMRRTLVPPMLFLAAWAAAEAVLGRCPDRKWRVVTVAALGLAVRMLGGFSPGTSWPVILGALIASAVLPGSVAAWSSTVGVVTAFLVLPLSLTGGSAADGTVIVLGIIAGILSRKASRDLPQLARWYPALGAATMIVVALGPRAVPGIGAVLPGWNLIGAVIVVVVVLFSLRVPPASAGACAVLASLMLGPVLPPTPEGGAVRLDSKTPSAEFRPGDGGRYSVDVVGENLGRVREGVKVGAIIIGKRHLAVRTARTADDSIELVAPRLGARDRTVSVWRLPPGAVSWKRSRRLIFDVPQGIAPRIELRKRLPDGVRLRVVASGPASPTSPRDIPAGGMLWWCAMAVSLIQLIFGSWRGREAWVPWMLLAAGLVVVRMPVEPLHLLLERHVVDLCLAALLTAWIPAAVPWIRRGIVFRPVAALLVPLALVTPHLTPSLWGDEPYHLALLESVVVDHDLDLTDNLEGGGAVGVAVVSNEHLFHSPLLAAVAAPGFLVGGRTGVLVEFALIGALLISLVIGRFERMRSPPKRAVIVLTVLMGVTFPVATFSTQVWPGVVGAAIVAGMLILVGRERGGRMAATVLALTAAAIKTRTALVTFPVALAGWWRTGSRKTRVIGAFAVATAAAVSLVVGWLSMGHPFGIYRRLPDLVPRDPALALTVVGGLFFDVAGGMAWTAPLGLIALAAVPLLWRRGGDGERALLIGGMLTVIALLPSIEWYGGGSPPVRYLVPLFPAAALSLGLLMVRPDARRRLIELVLPAAVFGWWALVTRPHFSVNPGDGRWWLTNALSRRFSADARALFPSFLAPSASTVVVPVILLGIAGCLWWAFAVPGRARRIVRVGPALWLIAALALVAAIDLRADTVVEAESAQVRRIGGQAQPPPGTPSRFRKPNGWSLKSGNALVFPLNLAGRDVPAVAVEVRVMPPGWAGRLTGRWDDGRTWRLPVRRSRQVERIALPPAPGPGEHLLRLEWIGRNDAEIFIDRIVVER